MKSASSLLVVPAVLVGLSVGACAPPPPEQSSGPGPQATNVESTERVYVVQKDDLGFWTIAEKVYGDGKHWRLIAEANPDVDVDDLREGRELQIPALPEGKDKKK